MIATSSPAPGATVNVPVRTSSATTNLQNDICGLPVIPETYCPIIVPPVGQVPVALVAVSEKVNTVPV